MEEQSRNYGFEDFASDFARVVDDNYHEQIGELARLLGAKLEGKSSNSSPTGTLLDLLRVQGIFDEGRIVTLVEALAKTKMPKAAELAGRYLDGLEKSTYYVFKAHLADTYTRLCHDIFTTDTVSNNNNESEPNALPDLMVSTCSSRVHDRLSDVLKGILPDRPAFLVIGQSGSGKSTACLQLVRDWLVQNQNSCSSRFDLVLYMSLSDQDLSLSLVDAIRYNLLPVDTKLTNRDIENILKVHMDSLLFIFDSLDDVPFSDLEELDHPSEELEFGKVITGQQLPSVPKLVTSSQSPHFRDCCFSAELKLHDLPNDRIESVIKEYFRREPDIGTNVLHHIKSNDNILDFCKVPLLLRMVCDIAKRENSIHLGKLEHMHAFAFFVIQNIFEKYRDRFHEAETIDFAEFARVVGHLALEILLKVQRPEVSPLIRGVTPDEKSTVALAMRAGFVKEVHRVSGSDSDSVRQITLIRFKNKFVQHFFAASRLREILEIAPDSFSAILDVITNNPRLHSLLLFLCGTSPHCAKNVLQRVRGSEDFRVPAVEYLYECRDIESGSKLDEVVRETLSWLSEGVVIRGDMSKYQQRASHSLLEKMKTEKVTLSSLHLNEMTSSLCLDMLSVGAPIQSMTISDVDMTLFRDLPDCPSLMKLQLCEVIAREEDMTQLFRWASRQLDLTCIVFKAAQLPQQTDADDTAEVKIHTDRARYRVFREEDGDSSVMYSELDLKTHVWQPVTAFEFCKFQFEHGLMNDIELKHRMKQSNAISARCLENDCASLGVEDPAHGAPEIMLEDIGEEDWPEDQQTLAGADEELSDAQEALHADMMTVTEFIQCLQRLHQNQEISTVQFLKEICSLRSSEKVDPEMCLDMLLGVADSVTDPSNANTFLEDVRELTVSSQLSAEQYLKVALHLATKSQLPVDEYLNILSDLKEAKEITKEEYISGITELRNRKLIGSLHYVRLRLAS